MREAAEEATALALVGGGGVLAAGRWLRTSGGVVSCSTSAYRVDGAHLLCSAVAGSLTLEFLVEGEGCALRAVVDVSCSSTS